MKLSSRIASNLKKAHSASIGDDHLNGEDLIDIMENTDDDALKVEIQDFMGETSLDTIYLIRDDQMVDEAQELAENIISGDFDRWPLSCIDWDRATEELRTDYSEVDLGGYTYYFKQR